jgi:NAD(P)-dependent dehydrogenase (short-subunit alcohol dehydrogenase family)
MAGQVIITGASSFVGVRVHLAAALARRGAPVLAVARRPLRGLVGGITGYTVEDYGRTPIGHNDIVVLWLRQRQSEVLAAAIARASSTRCWHGGRGASSISPPPSSTARLGPRGIRRNRSECSISAQS